MSEGRSLEELGARLDLTVEHVPVELIDPDPDNPNVIPDELMEALSEEIDRGFLQPILVRPGDPGRWKLIDGEHRWRLVREKGYETIPAVVTEADDDEARIRLLTMNRLRGQFVPIKLAYMLADLATRIEEPELRRRLGMDSGELRDHLRMASFTDDVGDRLKEAVDREAKAAPIVLSFPVSSRDAAAIERAIEPFVEGKTDRGAALAKVCREFERLRKAG